MIHVGGVKKPIFACLSVRIMTFGAYELRPHLLSLLWEKVFVRQAADERKMDSSSR
jgi:hypothetical protein